MTPVDTTPGLKKITIDLSDKHHLKKLALQAEVMKKRAELARVEWEQAVASSEAAGDAVAAKLGVPHEAKDVTIDLNAGIIHYRMPGIPSE